MLACLHASMHAIRDAGISATARPTNEANTGAARVAEWAADVHSGEAKLYPAFTECCCQMTAVLHAAGGRPASTYEN